jgi:SOS response regulatory protein OraA/RecX
VAAQALARRDLTVAELDERLARAGVPDAARDEVLGRLREARYLDDRRVALNRAARLAERGLGDAAIRADLERRGLPSDVVAEAVIQLEPEQARATRLVVTAGGGARAARVLARKGFAVETIEQVLEGIADDG